MKTATLPPLRVTPALRDEAESVLRDGETLSAFIEESLKANINRRRIREAFLARGLKSRDDARVSGNYVDASAALQKLDAMIAKRLDKAV